MNAKEFKDLVYRSYMEKDSFLVSDKINPGHWSTGNGLLYTGIFYTILYENGLIESQDIKCFSQAVNMCWANKDGFTVYGLLNRNQGRPDLEAHDDYIGVLSAAHKVRPSIAKDIYDYGSENKWCFDNTNPNGRFSFSKWFYRFPGLVGYIRLCAGYGAGILQNIMLNSKLRAEFSDPSDTILTWLMVRVLKRDKLLPEAIKVWEASLVQRYGNIGNVFAQYFGNTHPFSYLNGLDCNF